VTSDTQSSPFNLRTVVLMLAASLVAAAGFVLLMAFAPEIRAGHDGGAHPLSIAGTGYRGLVELLQGAGIATEMERNDQGVAGAGLLVVTLSPDTDPEALDHLTDLRDGKPTLYVLPKWLTLPLQGHDGWVRRFGPPEVERAQALLDKLAPLTLKSGGRDAKGHVLAPGDAALEDEQWLVGDRMTPLLSDHGRAILVRAGDGRTIILADPDLIANHRLGSIRAARTALEIVDYLRPDSRPVAFDLTLHGLAQSRSLLRTLLTPPFLALTLSLLGAALLAGLHAFGRFGPARRDPRALPPGKSALIENAAGLIRKARRGGRLGDAYAVATRDAAAAAVHAPHLVDRQLEAWLDRAGPADRPSFSQLAEDARSATTPTAVAAAAHALYLWRRSLRP
jgi:hypothetical protein